MKILAATVDWHETYANSPTLKVLVDNIPTATDLTYKVKNGIYYAELDGFVSFFHYQAPGGGFGGRKFNLQMDDGTTKALIGPWSSNSQSVNQQGFGPCMETAITDDPKAWERGHTFCSAAITVQKALEAAALVGVFITQDHNGFYQPSLAEKRVVALKMTNGQVLPCKQEGNSLRWTPSCAAP